TAGSGAVAFDNTTSTNTPITGFQAGDQIALGAFTSAITSASLATNGSSLQLTLTNGTQTYVVPDISFASGLTSGAALDGYQFVFDSVAVNGGSEFAVTVAPVPVTASVSGVAQEGQLLSATASVPGSADQTFTYQWQTSSDGSTWSDVSGATSATYSVGESVEGNYLRVAVTAGNGTSAYSTPTAAVADATPSIAVAIEGIAQEGQVLTAQVSGAENDDALSYVWIANGVTLGTGATYTVQAGDEGSVITLMVTDVADNGGGTASVQLDAGSVGVARSIEAGQTTVIGVVKPLAGDTLSLTQTGGTGVLSLGAVQPDGSQAVIYTAPASLASSALDAVGYTVTNQHNAAVASGSASVQLDAGDQFVWIGSGSGDWNTPANWKDITTGANPASVVAGAADNVIFNSSTQAITGTGDSASLTFSGDNAVGGHLTTGSLSVNGASGSTLDINAGASVTAATASLNGGDSINVAGNGARLTVTGALTVNGSLAATNHGMIQLGSVSLGDGLAPAAISTDSTSSIEIGTAGSAAAGAVTVDSGATLTSSAGSSTTIIGNVVDYGTLSLTNHGSLDIIGTLSGGGQVQIGNGTFLYAAGGASTPSLATGSLTVSLGRGSGLELGAAIDAGNTIAFTGSWSQLTLHATATGSFDDAATITGFDQTETILLQGGTVTSVAYT
ncbi:MAG: hypothetical protein JO227_11925, partial [Acetobacteraceae bacterium]|nr:hypothetical protein [Acetobacteraceae bacterium]